MAAVVDVRGNPSPEELAAALSVLMAGGGAVEEPAAEEPSRWNPPEVLLRRPLHPGPGAWRTAL